jgi:hypothetical protein
MAMGGRNEGERKLGGAQLLATRARVPPPPPPLGSCNHVRRPPPPPLFSAARCLDKYIELRSAEDGDGKGAAQADPRLVAIVERLLER